MSCLGGFGASGDGAHVLTNYGMCAILGGLPHLPMKHVTAFYTKVSRDNKVLIEVSSSDPIVETWQGKAESWSTKPLSLLMNLPKYN